MNGISQSAASQHVHELERGFGLQLLDRSTRPLSVTAAGRLYYQMCREVLRRVDEFNTALGRLKDEVQGTVRVASIYSVGLSDMSRLEAQFAERCPAAQIVVEYLRPEKIWEAVLADRADLGLVSYPEPTKEIAVIPWREEEMVVAAAASHPLAARSSVAPAELAGQDYVAFDEDLPIRREIDRYLREQGVHVNVTMHFDVIEMIKEAVAFGSGLAILPARSLHPELEQGRLKAIPIEFPRLARPVGVIHRRRKKLDRAALAFLELLQAQPAVAV